MNYNWSHTVLNTDSLVALDTGSYQLIVTDSIGCSDTIATTITAQLMPLIKLTPLKLCYGDCSGQMTGALQEPIFTV